MHGLGATETCGRTMHRTETSFVFLHCLDAGTWSDERDEEKAIISNKNDEKIVVCI